MNEVATRAPEGLSLILWTRPMNQPKGNRWTWIKIHLIVSDPQGDVLARPSENACCAHLAMGLISATATPPFNT